MRYNGCMPSPAIEPSGHREAVFGLAERDGSLLLVCNPRVVGGAQRDFWDLPGGAVRSGESLVDALVREWREEVGLAADVRALRQVVDGRKETAAGALLYTWRAYVFEVRSDGEPVPGPGITAAAWVPGPEALERLDAPYHEHLRDLIVRTREACSPDGAPASPGAYARLTWTDDAPRAAADPDAHLPRGLCVLAAAASVGDRALLAREIESARAQGESPARIVETLLQIVPYGGYPRAITAFGVLRGALPDAPPASEPDAERAAGAARGRATFEAVYGETTGAVLDGLVALDPVLARWTLEHAYGRVLARQGTLTLLERELLAVAILTALGGLDEPLLGHMRACVRLGATSEAVAGVIEAVPASVGEGRRDAARALLARLASGA